MKVGMQLLKLNPSLEDYKSTILPNRFLEFSRIFKLGENSFENDVLRKDNIDFDLPLFNVVIKSNLLECELEYIYSVKQIHDMLEDGENQEEYFLKDNFVKIAHLTAPVGGYLLMSLTNNFIYVGFYALNSEVKYEYICNDIFELASLLKTNANRFQLNNNTINSIYKNWGEDFWRVRENSQDS